MINRTLNKTAIAICVATSALGLSSAAGAGTVTIDLNTKQFIGDSSNLQRDKYFNIHSTAGDPGAANIDRLYIRNELNASYGRQFFSPFGAIRGRTNYPTTEQTMAGGAAEIERRQSAISYPFLSSRTVVTDHPFNVMGEGNDPITGAQYAADYFEFNYADGKQPKFYEPMNEPFVHAQDFVDGPFNGPQGQIVKERMADWFSEIGQAFDERNIDTKIIGYSSAFPSFELRGFDNFDKNQKMFMDRAGPYIDAYSTHLYDGINIEGQSTQRSGSNAEAILDLIETYSYAISSDVLPHAITEYGGITTGYPVEYSDEKSAQDLRSINHILFSLLERDDRILTSIPFITGISAFAFDENFNPYNPAVFRPDPEKIVSGKVLDYLPTEKAKFYQLWSDVKGYRVKVQDDDPDVAVQAFVDGNRLFVALNNFEEEAKTVAINFVENQNTLVSVKKKSLDTPVEGVATLSEGFLEQAPSQMTLNAHETVILEYQYSNVLQTNQSARIDTYYSDVHLQPISSASSIDFTFTDVELEQRSISFADVYAANTIYDQSVVDTINVREIRRLTNTLRSLERSFARIKARYPDSWQSSPQYRALLARVGRSAASQKALQMHYGENGYNDSEDYATLRMSIAREHNLTKQAVVRVNGHAFAVPDDWKGYDQITRDEFFGAIDIPIPAKYLKQNNTVAIEFPDSGGHLSSLILEVNAPYIDTYVPVDSVSIQHPVSDINLDAAHRLRAAVLPLDASQPSIMWTSSNPAVAQVDENGVVTPMSAGSVAITATSYDGQLSDTMNLNVQDKQTLRNTIVITNAAELQAFEPRDFITLQLDYVSDEDRDVAFELYKDGAFQRITKTTVPAGAGSTELTLTFAEDLSPSSNYRIISGLRAVGGNFTTTVDGHVLNNVEVLTPFVPPIADPNNLMGANAGFEFRDLRDFEAGGDGDFTVERVDSREAGQSSYAAVVRTPADSRNTVLFSAPNLLGDDLILAEKTIKVTFWAKLVEDNFTGNGDFRGGQLVFQKFSGGYEATPFGPAFWGLHKSEIGQWKQFEKVFTGVTLSPFDHRLSIFFRDQGLVWHVDDVVIEDLTVYDDNLLGNINTDFEDGVLAPFDPHFNNNDGVQLNVSPEAANNSGFGLHVTGDGSSSAGINLSPAFVPTLFGEGGNRRFRIEVDIKSNVDRNMSGFIRLLHAENFDGSGQKWWQVRNQEWTTLSVEVPEQSWPVNDDGSIRPGFMGVFSFSGEPIDYYLDNLRVTEIVD